MGTTKELIVGQWRVHLNVIDGNLVINALDKAKIVQRHVFFAKKARGNHSQEKTKIEEKKKKKNNFTIRKRKSSKSNKKKGSFLASMSHEIRTPLCGIITLTSILRDESDLTPYQKDLIETVNTSGAILLGIVNDILDYSKLAADKLKLKSLSFDLEECVEGVCDVLSMQAEKKSISLMSFIDPSINRQVLGDPGRLAQVLLNLLNNAIKFTDKGQVKVEVTRERGTLKQKGRDVFVFRVIDTGVGLSQHECDTVLEFEPFTQIESKASIKPKYNGTGLGLVICSKIVKLMKGTISVTSQKGKGTTFTLRIPLAFSHIVLPKLKRHHSSVDHFPLPAEDDRKSISCIQGKEKTKMSASLVVRPSLRWSVNDDGSIKYIVIAVRNKSVRMIIKSYIEGFIADNALQHFEVVTYGSAEKLSSIVGASSLKSDPSIIIVSIIVDMSILFTVNQSKTERRRGKSGHTAHIYEPLKPVFAGATKEGTYFIGVNSLLEKNHALACIQECLLHDSISYPIRRKSLLRALLPAFKRSGDWKPKPNNFSFESLKKRKNINFDWDAYLSTNQEHLHSLPTNEGKGDSDMLFASKSLPDTETLTSLLTVEQTRKREGKQKDSLKKASRSLSCDDIQADQNCDYPHLLKILIVEDNSLNVKVISKVLDKYLVGCQLTVVNNGQKAVEEVIATMVGSHTAPYDIILMDCMMPIMDGYKATKCIREFEAHAIDTKTKNVILALTANALNDDRQRCLDAGMDDYISKPINAHILIDKFRALIPHKMPLKTPE